MNTHVLEILDKRAAIRLAIEKLCADDLVLEIELRKTLEAGNRQKRKLLTFDHDGRTIRWDGGFVRLGKKPCKFVQSLYEKRQMLINSIAETVWGDATTNSNTISVTVCNLRKELANAGFPYEIITVECEKKEVEVIHPITKKPRKLTVQPEIKGFRISVKK